MPANTATKEFGVTRVAACSVARAARALLEISIDSNVTSFTSRVKIHN